MANALPITLHTAGPESSSGQSTAVDIGPLRSAVQLRVVVSSITTGVLLVLTLETSPTGDTWRPAGEIAFTARERRRVTLGPCERFVRLRWSFQGPGASADFEVTGEAHVLYADLDDLLSCGVRPAALEDVEDTTKVECLLKATADIDAAFATRYHLPLSAWGEDARARVVSRAVYLIFKHRGFDPEGADAVIVLDGGHVLDNGAPTAVEKWIRDVAAGRLHPVGVVDSTPTKREFGARVRSKPRREVDC